MSDKRPPDFDDRFRDDLAHLFEWRRDVRRFLADPVDLDLMLSPK